MKIVDKTKKNCTFGTLESGDCFKELEGCVLLRIKDIYNEIGEIENAVFLLDGKTTFFNNNETVVPLEVELIVK